MTTRSFLLTSFLLFTGVYAHAQTITTIAGTHVAGYTGNGLPATLAQLNGPNQVCADDAGNIYIADADNNVIRKIDPAGVMHLVAGNHAAGYSGDGGPATAAKLNGPVDMALDHAGNMYICDMNNSCIRKVDASGMITTIAGTGAQGYSGDGGPATAAMLYSPFGMDLDAAGNIYFADIDNNVVRKINTSGIITTIAGDTTIGYSGDGGPATAALFYSPIDVAADRLGNIYVADIGNSAIRKIDPSGTITTVAGTGVAGYTGDGMAATATNLQYPYAICVDTANVLYITDNANERIRKVDASGIITTIVGTGVAGYSGDGGPGTTASINNTGGIWMDAMGNLYIADYGNNVVRKLAPHTTGVPAVAANTMNVLIYPNPVSDNIHIDMTSPASQHISITMYDPAGAHVYIYKQQVHEGKNVITINAREKLPAPGNYIIIVRDDSGRYSTQRFTLLPQK